MSLISGGRYLPKDRCFWDLIGRQKISVIFGGGGPFLSEFYGKSRLLFHLPNVITFDQSGHHLCSTSAGVKDLSSGIHVSDCPN